MPKLYFVLLFFICSYPLFSQKIDTTYSYGWKNNSWVASSRSTTKYNSTCNISEGIAWGIDSAGNFLDDGGIYYHYFPDSVHVKSTDDVVHEIGSPWYGDTVNKTYYTYNEHWQQIKVVSDIAYIGGFLDYVATQETRYHYNNQGNIDTELFYEYQDGRISDSAVTINTYDVQNHLVQVVRNEVYFVPYRTSAYKTLYTYNSAGKQLTRLSQQVMDTGYVNTGLLTNTYDKNNYLIGLTYQMWRDSGWYSYERRFDTNRPDGLPIVSIVQNYDEGAKTWVNSSKTILHYNDCKTLPVTLVSFNGEKQQQAVNLSWQTASEINFSHFNIQRRSDASGFTTIGKVEAKGGNHAVKTNYTYVDKVLPEGKYFYYRLQIVDKDGSIKYSNVIPIKNYTSSTISLYPNPVSSLFELRGQGAGRVEIYNTLGQLKYSSKLNGQSDKVNVKPFGKGVYIVKVYNEQGAYQTKKIVVE